MKNPAVERYWQRYLATLAAPQLSDQSYVADQFGDTPELADKLGELVVNGIKTATCSALWEWEAEGSSIPTVGLKTIVLNSYSAPLCIIETTEVTTRSFEQVDAQFAYEEGEGDRSLESWRQDHWDYFSRVLPPIGKAPTPDMTVICERFRVVYQSHLEQFTIRECQGSEADTVLKLWQAAGTTVSVTDSLEDVLEAIAASSTHFLVAESEGNIIGSLIGAFDGWRGNMYRLAVHPHCRRYGVATALVGEVENRFIQQGVKRITALVEKEHPGAIALWQAVGYERDERMDRYVHNL